MQQILSELKDDLTWFVEQRDHAVMVLECSDTEVPYVAKMMDVVEAEHDSDLFVLFAHNVEAGKTEAEGGAHGYVSAVVASVRTQREGVNEIRARDGLEPWSGLPPACDRFDVSPSERLIHVLQWMRTQIPSTEHTIVFGLIPVSVNDPSAYATVVQGLLPKEELEEWMAGCRLILREDRAHPMLVPYLERNPSDWVLFHEQLDLSPGALTDSLVQQTANPDASDDERVVALVQLAALDFSHRRYADAFTKWGALFEYYAEHEQPAMQALCLCGAGDVLRATDKLPEAKKKYQQGLAYTKGPEQFPVMLNLLSGVGEVCIALEHWEEAEGYLELAEQIATTTRQVYPQCDFMGRRGIPLVALGKFAEARSLWRACVDVSRALAYYPRCIETLESLIALFGGANMLAEQREHQTELEDVKKEAAAAAADAEGRPSA